MGRTGGFTGGGSFLVDAESTGNGLGILLEDGFAEIEFFVVLVGAGDWADLGALAAARAFCQIYISGGLVNFGSEVSGLAFKAQKLGICQKLNI